MFPLQALSTCCEEGLTTTAGWWKMGPLVSFYEGDGLETGRNRGQLGLHKDCMNLGRVDEAGDGLGCLQLNFLKFAGGGS